MLASILLSQTVAEQTDYEKDHTSISRIVQKAQVPLRNSYIYEYKSEVNIGPYEQCLKYIDQLYVIKKVIQDEVIRIIHDKFQIYQSKDDELRDMLHDKSTIGIIIIRIYSLAVGIPKVLAARIRWIMKETRGDGSTATHVVFRETYHLERLELIHEIAAAIRLIEFPFHRTTTIPIIYTSQVIRCPKQILFKGIFAKANMRLSQVSQITGKD